MAWNGTAHVEQHARNGAAAQSDETHRGRKQEHERVADDEADIQASPGGFLMVAGQDAPRPVRVGEEEDGI